MTNVLGDLVRRVRGACNEWALLLLLGLVAIKLVVVFPADHRFNATGTSWQERDRNLYWQASQLFGRDPERLSEAELHNVKDWCRCLALAAKHRTTGFDNLTDDECQFVVDTHDRLAPILNAYYLGSFSLRDVPLYTASRRRLAGEDPAAAEPLRHTSPGAEPDA